MSETASEIDFDTIASQISSLSTAEHKPADFSEIDEIEPEEVDFEEGAWIKHVISVQSWLKLDSVIPDFSNPKDSLIELFDALTTDGESCFEEASNGNLSVTEAGWECLANRISQASRHMNDYCNSIDSGVAEGRAFEEWEDAWSITSTSQRLKKITAIAENRWIPEFVRWAERGELILNPTYQRNDVWPVAQAQELIDSILRGIPLPSVILNKVHGGNIEIVDGKQRITAILRFIGKHPKALAYVNDVSGDNPAERELFDNNYPKWKRTVKPRVTITAQMEKEHFLPYPMKRIQDEDDVLRESGIGDAGQVYYCQIKSKKVEVGESQEEVSEIFERTSGYKIPTIYFTNTELDQIALVFNRYNSQGMKLNAEEIRNAKFHDVTLCAMLLALTEVNSGDQQLLKKFEANDQREIPEILDGLHVKDNRFARTKISCWVASLLAQKPSTHKSGNLTTPSTKNQIDSLFYSIKTESGHPLKNETKAKELCEVIVNGLRILNKIKTHKGWHEDFCSKKGNRKWDSLPLVAAWLSCTVASVNGTTVASVDVDFAKKILDISKDIKPPQKQQSATQWKYICEAVLSLLPGFGVSASDSDLGENLGSIFGDSCLTTFDTIKNQ